VFLDLLPLTPNGKVDRRALPTPDLERSRLETKFVAPRTPVEKVLAEIWREVLGLERVGVNDNFFELGGHSLLATQVVSRVYQKFKIELSLRVFLEKPTVAGLTEVLENYETVPGQASAIAQILEKIDAMDAEEIRKMLHDKRERRGF
jgi:acyl carrier protein